MKRRPGQLRWGLMPVGAALLLGLLVLAWAGRLYHLDYHPIWDDEGFSVLFASRAAGEVMAGLNFDQAPLHLYLLHFWMDLAGPSPYALRFVSAWFGLLGVALGYALGRRLAGHAAGIWLVLFMGASPPLVYQAQNARNYTLMVAFALLAFHAWLMLVRPGAGLRSWAGWLVTMTAALYAHYALWILLFLQFLYLLPAARRGVITWRSAFVAHGALALTLLPLAWYWMEQLPRLAADQGASRALVFQDPLEALRQFWVAVTVEERYVAEPGDAVWGTAILAGLAILGVGRRWGPSGREGVRLATVMAISLATAYGVHMAGPGWTGRYLLFLAPLLYLLAAWGALGLTRRPYLGGLVGVLPLAVWALVLDGYYLPAQREELPALVRMVHSYVQHDDLLLSNSGYREVSLWYYHRWLGRRGERVVTIPQEAPVGRQEVEVRTLAAALGRERVWLIFFGADPENHTHAMPEALGRELVPVFQRPYGTGSLWLFARLPPPGSRASLDGTWLDFPGGLRLRPISRGPESPAAGDAILVGLQIQGPSEILERGRLALRLDDADGLVWHEGPPVLALPEAGWPRGELWAGLLVPYGTPPGRYGVSLVLQPASGGALPAQREGRAVSAPQGLLAVDLAAGPPWRAPPIDGLGSRLAAGDLRAPGLTLLGGSAPPEVRAGRLLGLDLHWQALELLSGEYALRLRVDGAPESEAAIQALAPAGYPMAEWRPGEVVRGRYGLRVPPTTPAGPQVLRLGLLHDGRLAAEAAVPVQVQRRPHRYDLPVQASPLDVVLGERVRLVGQRVERWVDADGSSWVGVTLYWSPLPEAVGPLLTPPYTVFVHLVDGAGQLVAQHDGIPGGGAAPTEEWVPGEIVEDVHRVRLPSGQAGSPLRLLIGLYDPRTGERLRSADGVDQVVLGAVP